MDIPTHHWASDRHARKMRLLEIIEKHPGITYEKCIGLSARLLHLSHRAVKEYLDELQSEELIENRDGKLYPSGYEEKSEKEKNEEDKTE